MKAEIKPRPQSKRLIGSARPVNRHINVEQAKASFEQGKTEQEKSQFQKGIQLYIKATMYDPNYFQAYCNIGTCYRALKRFNESRKYYKKSIALKPEDAISRYNLGNVERLLGNIEQSIIHYNFVLKLKEQSNQDIGNLYLNTLINLGISYKNKDLFEKAIECYEKVLTMNPNEESAIFNYAMSIVGCLHDTDSEIFEGVSKQQAEKATILFKKVLETNKNNQMAEFQMLRMSVLIDRSKENINNIVIELKKMEKQEQCILSDEIHLEIGHLMKLLKNYEASDAHFRKSLGRFGTNNKSELNIYDTPGNFANDNIKKEEDGAKITEEQGLRLIDQGDYEQVKAKLSQLEDSQMIKHVLELTLELTINETEQNLDKANQIFEKHFKKGGAELPMDSVSLAGHKAIGHLLSLQKKYNLSIKHFEYVGSKIKSEDEKSNLHSSLGNDYQAMGDIDKAVEEYTMALESHPESFQLNYNIGCCFYDEQNYESAMKHFTNFMELIQKDFSLKMETKNLYIADCLISMASCRNEMQPLKTNVYDIYLKAWNAVKEVRDLGNSNYQFEESKILSFYLEWADILEEKLTDTTDKKSQSYISNKQILLEVYLSLLDNPQCPDRDAILNNSATIYYEEKLYLNSLANFNQIMNEMSVSNNNLALTYLNLHEHYMANKYIMKAAEDSLDIVETFNKSIISWIYGFQNQQNQALGKQFQNKSDLAMLNRLEYGKLMIDAVTVSINKLSPGYSISQLQSALSETVSKDLTGLMDESEHAKIKALKAILTNPAKKTSDVADPNLVAMCVKLSQAPEKDLNELIKQCMSMSSQISQGIFESLLNLFIFVNRPHNQIIKKVLKKSGEYPTETVTLDLDRRITIEPDLITRQFGEEFIVRKVGDLVAHLISWQSEMESKLIVLLKTIEKHYYKSNIKKPMEYEYHFPRHSEWTECGITYMKIAYIIMLLIGDTQFLKIKGFSLEQMNYNIFIQLEEELAARMKNKQITKMSLGQKLVPATIYTFFNNKDDCIKFIKDLQKDSSKKQEIEIGKDCRELRIIISGIVRLVCVWEEPSSFMTVIRSFNQHQLTIESQAVIGLNSDLETLKESSEQVRAILEENKLLKR